MQLPLLSLSLHRPASTDAFRVPEQLEESQEYKIVRWVALVDAETRQAHAKGDEEQQQQAQVVHDFLKADFPTGMGLELQDLDKPVATQPSTEFSDVQIANAAFLLDQLDLLNQQILCNFCEAHKMMTDVNDADEAVFHTHWEVERGERRPVYAYMYPNYAALTILYSALKDSYAVMESFDSLNQQTRRYHRIHNAPDTDPEERKRTWWKVITLESYNAIAKLQLEQGYQARPDLSRFRQPFTLRRRDQTSTEPRDLALRNAWMSGAGPMILDANAEGFNSEHVMARIRTASEWPRGREGMLKALPLDNNQQTRPFKLSHFMTTELVHYDGLGGQDLGAMMFHGTLRRYAKTIDVYIDFDLGGGAMGGGFYLSSNPNEAKAFAIDRLKQARNSRSRRHISDLDAETRENELITIVAVYIRNPEQLEQRQLGTATSDTTWNVDESLNTSQNRCKTFYHNPALARFNQFVLHRTCAAHLTVVGVHDIRLTGDFEHTGQGDTKHTGEVFKGF